MQFSAVSVFCLVISATGANNQLLPADVDNAHNLGMVMSMGGVTLLQEAFLGLYKIGGSMVEGLCCKKAGHLYFVHTPGHTTGEVKSFSKSFLHMHSETS